MVGARYIAKVMICKQTAENFEFLNYLLLIFKILLDFAKKLNK